MAVACTSGGPASKATARNLVLITIDTLRADHIGAYGYARAQTKALDGLAASGLRFTAARTAVPLTLPSHATIHTGLLPPMHGVRENGEPLAAAHLTIATLLKDRCYDTATMVVVAGDHGEGLGDHGEQTHGMLLYDSTLRVPLIVAVPGRPAATRDEAVSLADVAPTLLRAAGVTPPEAMKGRDLLSTVRLKADTTYEGNADTTYEGNVDLRSVRLQPDRDRDLYSETEYPPVAG